MRLLAVSHTSLFSGAESALERTVLAAVERGWDVEVALPVGAFADRLTQARVQTTVIPDLKLPAGALPLAAALWLARTVGAAAHLHRRAARADVLLVNGLLALPAVRLARVRPPVVWFVHDVVIRRLWRAMMRCVAGRVDLAVCVSTAAADPLAAIIPVRVIPNGTPWPVEPAGPPREPAVVGCAGLLTPWKGQNVLLDAVAGMDPAVTVELVGGTFPKDHGYLAALRARAAEPDLAGRVRFVGQVGDVLPYVRTWTVLVIGSVDPENCPLVMLEAMSAGVPIVATAHGGPVEYVGDAGLLVPPDDAAALRGALTHLLADPGARSRMSRAGRELVRSRFQLSERADELLGVLASIRRRDRSVGAGAAQTCPTPPERAPDSGPVFPYSE